MLELYAKGIVMQRLWILSAAFLVCIALASSGRSEPSQNAAGAQAASKGSAPAKRELRPDDVADFMRLKLVHTQKLLEGLATENFDEIAKQSQDLGLLAEEENWRVYQTLEYRQHTAEFQRIAGRITKSAKDKNLDGAALGYVQLTMSCVECHKHCRGIRLTSAK